MPLAVIRALAVSCCCKFGALIVESDQLIASRTEFGFEAELEAGAGAQRQSGGAALNRNPARGLAARGGRHRPPGTAAARGGGAAAALVGTHERGHIYIDSVSARTTLTE